MESTGGEAMTDLYTLAYFFGIPALVVSMHWAGKKTGLANDMPETEQQFIDRQI